ncbi:MAG: prolyl oligopeptidase family serine peptidase [Litorimonas sp.]
MKNYLSAFGRVGFGVAMSLGLLSSAALVAVPSVASAAAPMEVYEELPRTDAVNVSPNGKRIALIAPFEDTKAVFVYDLANPDDVKVLPPPEGSLLNGIRWGSNKHVVMFTQFRRVDSRGRSGRFGREFGRNISTNVETGKQVILLEKKIYDKQGGRKSTKSSGGSSQGGAFTHLLPNDPDNILMSWGEYAGKAYRRHYRVNLDTGREKLARSLPIETSRTIMSEDGGSIIARSEYDSRAKEWRLYVGDDQMAKPILRKSVPKDENPVWSLITVLPDTGEFLINEGETDEITLYTVDPATGAQTRYYLDVDVNLPNNYDYSPLFDSITRELIGVSWTDDHTQVAYTAEPYRGWVRKASKVFKNSTIRVLSKSRDNSMVTLAVTGRGEPTNYFLFEPKAKSISPLGGRYPELKKEDLAQTIRYDFKARDGMQIPGYLTLPPGKTKADGPFSLVAMPHGGPIGVRDDGNFDFWAQGIANMGYAVFKPQFRGSGGYGYNYVEAGYGEFGGGMLTDTVDGVNKLVADGIANKDKMCVTGASYGGYQAFALPMIEPDLFKCALAVNGVSDINAIMEYEIARGGPNGSPIKFWNRVIGDFYDDKDRIASQSPANRIDEIKAEIVIVHGEDDMTVPYEQAEIMSKALKKAKRDDDNIIILEEDDHFLRHAESRRKVLGASEKLFAKHLK